MQKEAQPVLIDRLSLFSLREYGVEVCPRGNAPSPLASAAQSRWSSLTFSIRAITGTPKGHRFSQFPQAMQFSARALSAW